MFQENSNTYYISEPVTRRCFPQNLCRFVHFGAVSLIHSALEINAANRYTSQERFGDFFVQTCDRFLLSLFPFFSFFFNFITIIVVEFLSILAILHTQKFFYAVRVYNKSISRICDNLPFMTRAVVWTLISHGSRPIRKRETDKMW